MNPLTHSRIDRAAKVLFIIALSLTILYLGHGILMPIIFSGFLAIVLLPFADFTERFLGRGLSSLLAVLFASALIVGLMFVVALEVSQIMEDMPEVTQTPEKILEDPTRAIEREVKLKVGKYEAIVNRALDQFRQGSTELIEGTVSGLKETVLFFIVCPIYIFFFLLYRKNIFNFYMEYFTEERIGIGTTILKEIKDVLQQYLKGLSMVVLIVSALTTAGLLALQIPYAIFIGVLSGILTLIPFIGVFISALIPVLIAFATKDSVWYPLGVIGVYAVVQFLEGNIITPKIMGNKVNINPLIIIIALVLMGAVAGIVGMILTIPMLAVIKTVIDHSPNLKPWKYLLEEKQRR